MKYTGPRDNEFSVYASTPNDLLAAGVLDPELDPRVGLAFLAFVLLPCVFQLRGRHGALCSAPVHALGTECGLQWTCHYM